MAETEVMPADTSQAPASATAAETETVPLPSPAEETAPPPDHKRKLGEMEGEEVKAEEDGSGDADRVEVEGKGKDSVETEAKRPRVDGEGDESGATRTEVPEPEASEAVNGEASVDGSTHPSSEANVLKEGLELPQEDGVPSPEQQDATAPTQETSLKIEIPHNKVGVLIGKAGETIKSLQITSGAKIQITRDAEADLNSASRPVELIGSLESINKAEKLIKDVIAEADAGGSPALIAKGFGALQSGGEQVEIHVPNDKAGLVIGKGGETIKNLQTKSGARIQLIPQHLPEGDLSKERKIRITGNWKQIEAAKTMIMETVNQVPRSGSHMGGRGHQNHRPRGPNGAPQWGPHPHQGGIGMYPQNPQYHQPHGGNPHQAAPPSDGMGSGWDQKSGGPGQVPLQGGGYDYYGQGGHSYNTNSSRGPAPTPMDYNYRHPQAPGGYGPASSYPQSAPSQQSYGHGYGEQRYGNHMQGHQYYGQQPVNSQPGHQYYPPQQDPYGKPAYGGMQQGYGPPMPTQHGDPTYQGPTPTQQSYATQGSTVPPQPGPGYGQPYAAAPGGANAYMQPSGGYQQPASQVASAYPQQAVQPGGYGHYPPTQPGYTDQTAANNAYYGYYGGSTDAAAYGNNQPATGYGSASGGSSVSHGQVGYAQPQANPTGYEQQSVPPAHNSTPQAS